MTTREHAPPAAVAWIDLHTPDLAGARAFYGALLGWSYAGGDDPGSGNYTMAQLGGRNVAGMASLGAHWPFPAMWSVYLSSDDVEETARNVSDAGGSIVLPPIDVMEYGRMAFFADPTGAHFGAWEAKQHAGTQVVDEPGATTWHEVYTRDAARARAFYRRVLGLEEKRLEAPGIDYFTLQKDGRTVFGLMQMGPQFPPDLPSHWNTYFQVVDVEAAADQAGALGGQVVAPPFDTPYGRMAVAIDPCGAPFCVIAPASPPEGW